MEITSKQNSYIKEYRKLVEQRKYRRQSGFFPCEGAKLAVEAVKSGCTLGENAYVTVSAEDKYPNVVGMLLSEFLKRLPTAFPTQNRRRGFLLQ